MDLLLKGKMAVVAGGSSGIGLGCAHAFAQEVAKIAIIGRQLTSLEKARFDLSIHGGEVLAEAVDLSRDAEVEKALASGEDSLGAVDFLVNCAGATKRGDFPELGELAWRYGFESKFMPYMNMCTVVLRRFNWRKMRAPTRSFHLAIVNVIEKGGKSPISAHLPGGAANATLMLATSGLAQALGAMGLRINAVNPASIMTARLIRRHDSATNANVRSSSKRLRDAARKIPLERFGEPHEVTDVVMFLASPRASYVLGSNLLMDGGLRPIT